MEIKSTLMHTLRKNYDGYESDCRIKDGKLVVYSFLPGLSSGGNAIFKMGETRMYTVKDLKLLRTAIDDCLEAIKDLVDKESV
jgi:hypothetical protein